VKAFDAGAELPTPQRGSRKGCRYRLDLVWFESGSSRGGE
jgi:hypothetical protein